MGGSSSSKKAKGTQGAYARNHVRPVRWRVDYDYLAILSPEEKAWLAEFSDAYYNGKFTHVPADSEDWGPKGSEQRRAAYRAKNLANRDLYTRPEAAGGPPLHYSAGPPESAWSGETDESPPPAYLDSEEYKAALAKYRAAIDRKAPASTVARARAAVNKARKKQRGS